MVPEKLAGCPAPSKIRTDVWSLPKTRPISFPDWIEKNEPEIELLIARVGKKNLASNKTFSRAGFSLLPIEITETMKLELILPNILERLNTNSNVTDSLISEKNGALTHNIYRVICYFST